MIDTIRLKIPLTPIILLAFQNKYCQSVVSNIGYGTKYFAPLIVPPFGEQLAVIKGADYPGRMNMYFYVEGSLPRVAFGENVRLLHPSSLSFLLKRIETALVEQFGDVPAWQTWEVQRLDLVYAWKYASGADAIQALEFLKYQVYKEKNKHTYKETVTFAGKSFSVTFYLKEAEFRKFGYKRLVDKGNQELADKTLAISTNMLRYEIRMHKTKLFSLCKKKSKEKLLCKDICDLPIEWYYHVLADCRKELLRTKNNFFTSDQEALQKLLKIHGRQKGLRLFFFWKVYYLKEEHIIPMVKKAYNSTVLYKNFKDLEEAGVGIPHITSSPQVESIPSPHAPVARATEQD